MSLPAPIDATYERVVRGPVSLLVRRSWRAALDVDALLGGAPIDAWGEPRDHDLRGRDTITVVGTSHGDLVAKSITRGGALRLVARRWFARGERLVAEALLGERLRGLGLDTPPLVVGRVTRGVAGFVTLDAATARLDGARDLFDAVGAGHAPEPLARAAGAVLRRMHDVGFRHRDLTVKNLLAPRELLEDGAGELAVIDLDRCTLRDGAPLGRDERVASVARLLRSGVKRGMIAQTGVGVVRDVARGYGDGDGAGVVREAADLTRRQVELRRRLGLYRRRVSASRRERDPRRAR